MAAVNLLRGEPKRYRSFTTSMVDARPDHFDEVCKYMYCVYFRFLPFLLFRSCDLMSSSNLNPTLGIDPMTKSLSKSRAARWLRRRRRHDRHLCCYLCGFLVDCCLPLSLPLFPPAAAVLACPRHCHRCCLPVPLTMSPPP
jgi:hypothetical protein